MTATRQQDATATSSLQAGRFSPIHVSCADNILRIWYDRARPTPNDRFEIALEDIFNSGRKKTPIRVKSDYLKNRILFFDTAPCGKPVVVFTRGATVMYYRHDDEFSHPLARLVEVRAKAFHVGLTKRGIRLFYAALIINRYGAPVGNARLTIQENFSRTKNVPVYAKPPSRKIKIKQALFYDTIPMQELLNGEPLINATIQITVDVGGLPKRRTITKYTDHIKNPQWYYAPLWQTRVEDYAVHIRRTNKGGLNLVRRKLEPIEKTGRFIFYESRPVSFLMYHIAHLVRRLSNTPVNIYFEKLASKADEGALEVFRAAQNCGSARNYFILSKDADEFPKLRNEIGVVSKFSLKAYWLTYRANNIIATEAPAHINIMRNNNYYIRSASFSQKFVMLQHGIIYMKAMQKKSAFNKGKEAAVDHIVVSSRKEQDVVADMLNIKEEQIIKAGLPIFDRLVHNHIAHNSPDIITIMLTWKPYDEHFQDFTQSSYYQTVVEVFEALQALVPAAQLRIQAHPKFVDHLNRTAIRDAVWHGSISELLSQTKLLITDYSSVCYNVFYQGGAVFFYQPDLARYEQENGQLIPARGEYIGRRAFTIERLVQMLRATIRDGHIDLTRLRTARHVARYKQINEYSDGRNVGRIVNRLQQLGLLGSTPVANGPHSTKRNAPWEQAGEN